MLSQHSIITISYYFDSYIHVEGYLNFVDRDFKISSFQAYEFNVTHLHHLRDRNILISIGHDEQTTLTSTVKIWNLDKLDKNDNPVCIKAFKVEKYTVAVCTKI